MADSPDYVSYGGALTCDGDNRIYAFGFYQSAAFWTYDISNNSWAAMADAPVIVNRGAALTITATSTTSSKDVTFDPEPPVSLDVNVTQTQLTVGNIAEVDITAYDQYDNINTTAELTLAINVTDLFGNIVHQFNITKTPYTLTHIEIDKDNVIFTNSTIGTP